MQDHYHINDSEMRKLEKRAITPAILYKNLKHFTGFKEFKSQEEISVVCLMHYIDFHGDFNEKPNFVHKRIARAVFNSMDAKDKLEVIKYLSVMEDEDDD